MGPVDESGRRQASCPALEAELTGRYDISFVAGGVAASSAVGRSRRLLQRSNSETESFAVEYDGCGPWEGGYLVCGDKQKRRSGHVDLTGAQELPRWLGASKGGNRVMGGLVLNQVRSPMDPDSCKSKHSALSAKCTEKRFFER